MKKQLITLLLIFVNAFVFGQNEIISPDGKKRVEIHETPDKKFRVVVNSTPHKTYQRIVNNKIYFVTDSFSVVYVASCEGGYRVIVDGKELPRNTFDPEITVYGSDRQWCYLAANPTYSYYCFNGKEATRYDKIRKNSLKFSEDYSHMAYIASINSKWVYIIDGVEQPYFGEISEQLSFSSNGEHWAYMVQKRNKWFYVIDGAEQTHYDELTVEGILFSQNGEHWAYMAKQDKKWFCVTDGKEPPHEDTHLCAKLNNLAPQSIRSNEAEFYIGLNYHHLGKFSIKPDLVYKNNDFDATTYVKGGPGVKAYIGMGAGSGNILYAIDIGLITTKTDVSFNDRSEEDKFSFLFLDAKLCFTRSKIVQPFLSFDYGSSLKSRLDIDFGEVSSSNGGRICTDREYKLKIYHLGFGTEFYPIKHLALQGSLSYGYMRGWDTQVTFYEGGGLPILFYSRNWNYDFGLRIIF